MKHLVIIITFKLSHIVYRLGKSLQLWAQLRLNCCSRAQAHTNSARCTSRPVHSFHEDLKAATRGKNSALGTTKNGEQGDEKKKEKKCFFFYSGHSKLSTDCTASPVELRRRGGDGLLLKLNLGSLSLFLPPSCSRSCSHHVTKAA